MPTSVNCHSCGQQQELPEGYSRPHYRCTRCGAINETPVSAAVKVPERFDLFKAEPVQTAITAAPPEPAQPAGERELLIQGTDDEWDRNPYSVRGDVPTAKCPECGRAIHEGVTRCKHCGVDFAAKQKAERIFVPLDCTWENGWPIAKRLTIFGVLQVINLAVLLAPLWLEQSSGLYLSGAITSAILQAFLVGTFDRLHLTRNVKGKVVITHAWRYAFIPRPPETIRWKEHEGVRIMMSDEFDPFDWMMAGLLALYLVVPGVLFWWYVIRPDAFDVVLCKDHGHAATNLCRTTNQARAKEIQTTISEAAALPVLK